MLLVPGTGGAGERSVASPPTIVVIDRQSLFLHVLAGLLESAPLNARVLRFTESKLAVEEATYSDVDLVLKVMLMAESEERQSLLAAAQSGAMGFLTKDVTMEELLDAVRAVLDGHMVMSSALALESLAQFAKRDGDQLDLVRQLSPSELEILTMIGNAHSVEDIACARGSSKKTIRNHLASIYRKLHVTNRIEAVLWAARKGLVEPAAIAP
ncbi:MAG: response regulator transcription factor [Chloroflexi bacterium]|nr:MAG: response regulator transcription factor [Chloroflexota bacterium]